MPATLTWKGDEWLRRVLIPAASMAVEDTAKRGAVIVQRSMRKGAGASSPGSPPNRRSGSLARSIVGVGPRSTGKPLTGAVGTNHIAARINEFGGTIRPKKQKALCFPINAAGERFARTRGGGGVKAYTDGEAAHMRGVLLALMFKYNGPPKAKGKRAKAAPGGKVFLFKRNKKGGGVWGVAMRSDPLKKFIDAEPMFVVTRQVVLPARPMLRPLVTNPEHRATLTRHMARVFRDNLRTLSRSGGV